MSEDTGFNHDYKWIFPPTAFDTQINGFTTYREILNFNFGKETFGMKAKVRMLTGNYSLLFQIKDEAGILRKLRKLLTYKDYRIFLWCHHESNLICISIDGQSFILFQNRNPTRFSTRLFFIVLLAISRVVFPTVRKSVEIVGVLSVFSFHSMDKTKLFCQLIRNLHTHPNFFINFVTTVTITYITK